MPFLFHGFSSGIPLLFPVVCVGCLETMAAVHFGGVLFSFHKHALRGYRVTGSACGLDASVFFFDILIYGLKNALFN